MSDDQERRGDTTPTFDEPPFEYSIRRADVYEIWDLGKDTDLTMSAIRAATESLNRLPFVLFQRPRERLLIDFLCGDPLDDLIVRSLRLEAAEVFLWRKSSDRHKVIIPLSGITLRAFEALLYSAKFALERPQSIVRTRLDGGLLYVMGFSMHVIESDGIPF